MILFYSGGSPIYNHRNISFLWRNVNPAVASIIMSLESVFGVVGAAIILGEKMTPREYIGCAIVFAAVILSQLDFTSLKKKKAASEVESKS